MRSAARWLCLVLSGCIGGVHLAGDAEERDGRDAVTVDVSVPPPPVSPRWCPAEPAERPCRPVERARFVAEGRIAALIFDDGGARALTGRRQSGAHTGSVDLLRLGADGSFERREVMPLAVDLVATPIGSGFAAFVSSSAGEPATFHRVAPDGSAAYSTGVDWYCEQLTWTGTDLRCLTVTTRDVSWRTVANDGATRDEHDFVVEGFLRVAVWSPGGPGLLYTGEGDEGGDLFVRVDPAGSPAAGPTTIHAGAFADMLLAAGPSDFVVLGLLSVRSGSGWSGVDVVVGRIDADGTMRRRPAIVDHVRLDTHVPSWGPTYFNAAAGTDDVVVAYRDVEPGPDGEEGIGVAHPFFRVVTNDGVVGERNELAPTTDDDWLGEWIFLARAGTGLAVARTHSRGSGTVPALDIWLGCCE